MVLDTETSGALNYSPRTEIVEISIINEDGIPIVDTLIKPQYPVPDDAIRIHGITNETLQSYDVPTFVDAFPGIYKAIKDKCIVVYNADYDIPLLKNVAKRHCVPLPDFTSWCLMKAYADHYKAPGKYGNYAWQSLTRACEQQNVVLEDAHRALGDTLATYKLLQKLASLAE